MQEDISSLTAPNSFDFTPLTCPKDLTSPHPRELITQKLHRSIPINELMFMFYRLLFDRRDITNLDLFQFSNPILPKIGQFIFNSRSSLKPASYFGGLGTGAAAARRLSSLKNPKANDIRSIVRKMVNILDSGAHFRGYAQVEKLQNFKKKLEKLSREQNSRKVWCNFIKNLDGFTGLLERVFIRVLKQTLDKGSLLAAFMESLAGFVHILWDEGLDLDRLEGWRKEEIDEKIDTPGFRARSRKLVSLCPDIFRILKGFLESSATLSLFAVRDMIFKLNDQLFNLNERIRYVEPAEEINTLDRLFEEIITEGIQELMFRDKDLMGRDREELPGFDEAAEKQERVAMGESVVGVYEGEARFVETLSEPKVMTNKGLIATGAKQPEQKLKKIRKSECGTRPPRYLYKLYGREEED